ncbi:MAG: membrane protein insertase YidC [Agarilytica sp.]
MNLLRNGLIGGILVVVFLLFIQWNEFQERQVAASSPVQVSTDTPVTYESEIIAPDSDSSTSQQFTSSTDDLPVAPTETSVNIESALPSTLISRKLIHVKTDTLNLLINPEGGDIVQVTLPKHLADLDKKDSEFLLLGNSSGHTYIAQSDLIGTNGTHTRNSAGIPTRSLYASAQSKYELNEGENSLSVDLTHTQQDGTEITKRFSFERGSYEIDIDYIIDNKGVSPWKAAMYGRIKRDDYKPEAGGMFQLQPFLGAATTTNEDKFEKLDFDDIRKETKAFDYQGGWVALVQHYYVSAWVPDNNTLNKFKIFQSSDKKHFMLQFTTPQHVVAPGTQHTISSSFYAGPKIIRNLEKVAPGLDLTVDFGVLWFIAKPLFLGLDTIHSVVGNWGFAIILLTFLIKLVFFYPSAISYRSMAKMRKLMPLMQDLKERYGDDRQRMGTETMKLYKKEGVNPLGGCLPMLMQMPVFMALYWMIMESVELRHSPFMFWVSDLSVQDPFFILPVIMGVIMFVQQKLNPPPQDPMQAKIFQMMPIGFTFILMFLPAALTLYMAVNTALSFMQQYIITKQIEKAD